MAKKNPTTYVDIAIEDTITEEDGTKIRLVPSMIYQDGKKNIYIRMVDPDGDVRRVYKFQRVLADVEYYEKGEF